MTTTRLYTAEDLLAMGSEAPFILIEGRLIDEMPSGNTSSKIAARIVGRLFNAVDPPRGGEVYGADGGFILHRDPDTVIAPDAAFVRAERMPSAEAMGDGFVPVPPDLAVEVLSPSNRPGENARKVAIYRECGVPLVWYVDPFKQIVIVYAQNAEPRTLAIGDTLDGGDVLPGFALPLTELFA
jgi:Uma2 family endonuclease